MAWFWKFKAWTHSWVSKVIWLVLIAAIILAVIWYGRNVGAIWKTIDNLMRF